MYNRSVFSTEDHDLLITPLLDKWIQKAMEQLTYEYFERILSSNATSKFGTRHFRLKMGVVSENGRSF